MELEFSIDLDYEPGYVDVCMGYCPGCDKCHHEQVPEIAPDKIEDFYDLILDAFYDQLGVMAECEFCGKPYPHFPKGYQRSYCTRAECFESRRETTHAEAQEARKEYLREQKRTKALERKKERERKERVERRKREAEEAFLRGDNFGYVYLQMSENGLYKIGRAKNVEARRSALDREIPVKIKVVHKFSSKDYILAEKYMHDKYADNRIEYEWFGLNSDQVQEITQIPDFGIDHLLTISF